MTKKTFFFVAGILIFFSLAPHVFAADGFVALAPIPGLTEGATANTEGLAIFFNNLYRFAIGMAAVLAVIMIIWGGIEYSTQDVPGAKQNGKDRILQAIFGLILVLSPALVFSIINPSILNLSINLDKLDTTSGFPTGTGGGTGSPTSGTPDPASGCTSVVGTAGILQIATCPSAAAATKWGESCTAGNLSAGSKTALADGTVTSAVMFCTGTKNYVFIQTKEFFSWTKGVNSIQPLAVTTANQNNGSEVMQFVNTCQSIGRSTCISDLPTATFFLTPCLPTPKTALPEDMTPAKCFNEKLSCEDTSGNMKCDHPPSWTPFQ